MDFWNFLRPACWPETVACFCQCATWCASEECMFSSGRSQASTSHDPFACKWCSDQQCLCWIFSFGPFRFTFLVSSPWYVLQEADLCELCQELPSPVSLGSTDGVLRKWVERGGEREQSISSCSFLLWGHLAKMAPLCQRWQKLSAFAFSYSSHWCGWPSPLLGHLTPIVVPQALHLLLHPYSVGNLTWPIPCEYFTKVSSLPIGVASSCHRDPTDVNSELIFAYLTQQ